MNDIFYPVAHRSDGELAALTRRYDTFDENFIPEVFRHALGMTAVSWKKPESWSTSHVLYIVTVRERERPLVIRANIGWGERETYMDVEKCITDKLAGLNIPVNRILHVDTTRERVPFDFQIQDALEGVVIEDNFDGTRDEYDAISFDLGRYVAMWGELELSGFGRFDPGPVADGMLQGTKQTMYGYIVVRLDDDIRFLSDHGVISARIGTQIRKLFETYTPVMNVKKATLVQYDLADHNIMFDGVHTITGIFDWEAAVAADPLLDLASAPTWKTAFPREDKLIEGYRSVRDLPSFHAEKMHIYRLRTMLWKMVYALRAGIMTRDRRMRFGSSLVPFGIVI